MQSRSISQWATLLRTTGANSLPGNVQCGELHASCAGRGMDEAWFLAWRIMGSTGVRPPFAGAPEPTGPQATLWKACMDASVDVDAELARLADSGHHRLAADAGALIPQGLHKTIEVWTETELASIHALWRVGALRQQPKWQRRAMDVARWHVTHLQPDNATNRPWAAYLFALLAVNEQHADAGLYADTLIHNCQVQNGRPDPLSALILLDGAEALESLAR